MSDDGEALDIFSRAIVEFREEILLRIDTALVRLRKRAQDASVVIEDRSEPDDLARWSIESGSQSHSARKRLVEGVGAAEFQSLIKRDGSRKNKEMARRDSPGGLERPLLVTSGPEPDPESKSAPIDSFERLDALARLLDQRLKLTVGTASNSSVPSGEVGESHRLSGEHGGEPNSDGTGEIILPVSR